MIERPTQWPDGRKLGGENGYPPEWYAWAQEREAMFVARQMLAVPGDQRRAVHQKWLKHFPHATEERIKALWDEAVKEEIATRKATKRNSCAISQRKRNGKGK